MFIQEDYSFRSVPAYVQNLTSLGKMFPQFTTILLY